MVYRPTARVLTVLELLQSYPRMTGPELAQRLEVDVRTVRHYIEMLQDLGIPVEAERGRYGAYYLRPGYKLPPLIFTEEEAVVLALSLLIGRGHGFAGTAPAFEGVLAKLERVLPAPVRARVQAVQRTVTFRSEPVHAAPATAHVTALSEATQTGSRVRLRYRSARSDVTKRAFDPYGVVSHLGVWYTIGHCHLRRGQRLFRLDRILEIEPNGETFSRPAAFDALAAVHHALATVPKAYRFEVWLDTSLEVVRWWAHVASMHFEEQDGGVVLRGEIDDLSWIAPRLAGLGVPLVIREPPELRAVLRDYALALARDAGHE
jgi:predicted DNA-binding transcriptional regulator YafY